jgi:hypothetical protein
METESGSFVERAGLFFVGWQVDLLAQWHLHAVPEAARDKYALIVCFCGVVDIKSEPLTLGGLSAMASPST